MERLWDEELSETEATELIERIATRIEKRQLQVPAILALEMHKPLASIVAQGAVVGSPFLIPFLGFDGVNNYSRLFARRDNWEKLIQRLETGEKLLPEGTS